MIQVEICTPSAASALSAKQGGATRIELCRDLACGGLTPTDDDILYCTHELGLRTHVLIRPRPGDFCYSADEVAEIMATIDRCRELGAAAVVVGFLTSAGRIDTDLTRRAVRRAEGMEVTFHRAFDEAQQDPIEALHEIAACGCHRLLTSGQQPTAIEGAAVIAHLVQEARNMPFFAGRFAILPGSGITPANVCQLLLATGASEVHGSCKTTLADGTIQTDAEQVRQMIKNTRQI